MATPTEGNGASRMPVALIIYNRPDVTRRVFAEIAKARPPELFVVADGPRADRPGDVRRCLAAREVTEQVDWDCTIHRKYSDENLGCGLGPMSGIGWVFDQVEAAIILEDDCVPHPTFFRFCDELLGRYVADERVMQVAGNNFPYEASDGTNSYFFSMHNLCAGGWATWRRAWSKFDPRLSLWPEVRDTDWIERIVLHPDIARRYRELFDRAYATGDRADYWDYQWTFACWMNHGLTAIPKVALLTNIGFGPDATHTKSESHPHAFLPSAQMEFPLQHPTAVYPRYENMMFGNEAFGLTRRPRAAGLRRAIKRIRPRSRLRRAVGRVRSVLS